MSHLFCERYDFESRLCFDGVSSILNGNCVVLLEAMGGGPQDTWRWRGRVAFNAAT